MTLCVDMRSVFDYKNLDKDLNKTMSKRDWDGQLNTNWNALTIRTLFKYTPANDSILQKIFYKIKHQSRPIQVNADSIAKHINILKFIYYNYICYQIALKKPESLSYREIAVSSYYQFVIQDLYFKPNLEGSTDIKLMISPFDHLPYKEIISTRPKPRRLFRDVTGRYKADTNTYQSEHKTIEKTALSSPYETRCRTYRDYGFHGRDDCIEECTASRTWSTFHKISLMSPVSQPSDSLPFTRESLENRETYSAFTKIQEYCQYIQCGNIDCHDTQIVTSTDSTASADSGRTFKWYHRISSEISFRIVSTAALPFVEFVLYILGSISTWTGLSVITCNPVVVAKLMYKNIESRSQMQDTASAKQRKIQRIINLHRTRQRVSSFYATRQNLRPPVEQKFNLHLLT